MQFVRIAGRICNLDLLAQIEEYRLQSGSIGYVLHFAAGPAVRAENIVDVEATQLFIRANARSLDPFNVVAIPPWEEEIGDAEDEVSSDPGSGKKPRSPGFL